MATWAFYDFCDDRGINVVREWLTSIPVRAAAKINTRILFMEAQSIWPEQYISALKNWPHLLELRIVCDGNQYRPLAFYGPNQRGVTLVMGAVEKSSIPRRILERADEHRKLVITGRARIVRHEFD